MAAFWTCELAPTEMAGSDAFNRNQLVCRQALTHDRVEYSRSRLGPAGERFGSW